MSEENVKKVSSVSAQENIKDSISSVKTLLSKISARNPKPAYGGYTSSGSHYNSGYSGNFGYSSGYSPSTRSTGFQKSAEEDLDEQFKTKIQEPFVPKKTFQADQYKEVSSSEDLVLVHRRKDKYNSYIYTPAGNCPYKPEGYKTPAWESGPCTEEAVKRWCIKVYDSAPERMIYHPHSIIYWAQFFWQKEDLKRVKKIILDLFNPERNADDDDDYV
ncbi:MAG: hypothetical protein EKK64_10725 [Neisseriaceae bacterium]|nr:MAG: hypothetical protein EKK64_10725 [Neisseriaceae bacterium]